MTGYLFVCGALLAGAVKGYCGKKTSGVLVETKDAIFANLVRMLFCIAIGALMVTIYGAWERGAWNVPTLLISALSGFATATFTVTWLLSVKRGAYMLVEVFLLSSVILPILLCAVGFGEEISLIDWLGIALLVVAAYLMCTYNQQVKGKVKWQDLVLLLLCAMANGTTDFSQKLFVKMVPTGESSFFNLLTYLFAALFLGAFFLLYKGKKKEEREGPAPIKNIVLYIGIMAVCLFLHSYLKTLAAIELDAVVLYPLTQGGSLILSMLMSAILFREKISGKGILGVTLAFGALLLINSP